MHGSSQEQNHAHSSPKTQAIMNQYHAHAHLPNQCGSSLIQFIDAPLLLVWSLVRDFDNPQLYKRFIKTCSMVDGDGGIGSIREIEVVSGLPAELSRERLDMLDDEVHMMIFSMIGGDHRLVNYQSTTTLHEEEVKDKGMTILIESYVVDVPGDSTREDTCCFAETIIGCNLKSLARVSEKMAIHKDQNT